MGFHFHKYFYIKNTMRYILPSLTSIYKILYHNDESVETKRLALQYRVRSQMSIKIIIYT